MKKRKNFDRDYTGGAVESTPGGVTTEKIPLSINGGKSTINEFMSVPTSQLIPFQNKQGSDFSRKDKGFFLELVESVRDSGIINPLIVRPIGLNQYEILAGETRWMAAQEVGLAAVPCHIMDDVDDATARRIFTVTNLLRRTLLPSDRVNGWWHYYQSMKEEGRLKELREGVSDPEISVMGGSSTKIQYRQIMNYVNMHALIPEWLERLDEGLGMRTALEIARLDAEKQRQLLPYLVSDGDAHLLVEIASGKNAAYSWSEELLSKILAPVNSLSAAPENQISGNPAAVSMGEAAAPDGEVGRQSSEEGEFPSSQISPVSEAASEEEGTAAQGDRSEDSAPPPEETPAGAESIDTEQYQQEKQFRKARPSIMKGVRSILRPNDYGNAESVIVKALTLYYELLDKGERV